MCQAGINILAALDFDKFNISILTVENNYGDNRIGELLAANGYEFVTSLKQARFGAATSRRAR
jgi:hypothetical protein